MKKALKWTGITLGSLLLLGAAVIAGLNYSALSRLTKHYDVQTRLIVIPADSAAIIAGKKWVNSMCTGCHGDNLAGTKFFNTPDLGTINAPNLTPGAGGVGRLNTDADWVRAIQHGIGYDGRPLLIMPAKDFNWLSDEHLGQIIAYLKTLPPVDQAWDLPRTTVLCNVLFQAGAFGDALQVETIDHASPAHTAPPRAVSPEYGGYLVRLSGCRTCHGEQLNGGKDPNPAAPPTPNLTPGGSLPGWGPDGFVKAMRTGVTPLGKEINGEFMPWKYIGRLDDDQLQAIYAYLMHQPSIATAQAKE